MLHDQFRTERIFSSWRVRPHVGESAEDYFGRLVRDNADCLPERYMALWGLANTGQPIARMLEEVLRLPLSSEEKASLTRWTPVDEGKYWTLDGMRFSRARFVRRGRYCDHCVRDHPYHRVWWDLKGYEICPIHDLALVRPTRFRQSPSHGFTRGGLFPVPPLSKTGRSSLEGYVLERLGVVGKSVERPLLDDESLNMVLKFVPKMGRLLANPRSPSMPPGSPSDNLLGFDAMSKDMAHLEDRLSNWIVANLSQDDLLRGATTAAFGHGRNMCHKQFTEGSLPDVVATAQVRACARHGNLPRAVLSREGVGSLPTFKQVHKSLSVTVKGLNGMLAKLEITPERTDKGTVHFTPAIVDRIREELIDLVSLEGAAQELGCSASEANLLARYLAAAGWPGCMSLRRGAKMVRHYLRSELNRIVQRLAEFPSVPEGMQVIGIEKFQRYALKSMAHVMAEVLAGKVECFQDGSGRGFASLRFRRQFFKPRGLAAEIGRKHIPGGAMLKAEFTAMTGIASRGISHLVSTGYVRAHIMSDMLLDRDSAVAFHRDFVNVVQYLNADETQLRVNILIAQDLELTREFSYEAVQALVVRRSQLAERIGSLREVTPKGLEMWRDFVALAGKNCPSSMIPQVPGDGSTKIYTTSRKWVFRVNIEDESLFFKIVFRANQSTRMWKIYQEHGDRMRKILASFQWESGERWLTATVRASSHEDIDVITREIGEVTKHFRYHMP